MLESWFHKTNYLLILLVSALFLISCVSYFKIPQDITITENSKKPLVEQKPVLARSIEEYQALGTPLLDLQFHPIAMQLPNLKKHLTFLGKNSRPDADPKNVGLHFGLTSQKGEVRTLFPGKKLYLLYRSDQRKGEYVFCPNNEESTLWIEATPTKEGAKVTVAMLNEENQIVQEPKEYAHFEMQSKGKQTAHGSRWELDKWRVDGTLLARQRARWHGKDLFLLHHGGEEYGQLCEKERIDIGQNEDLYSVYVSEGDCLIWKEGRWHEISPEDDSSNYPLLVVNKIEDRLMRSELWDVEGKSKVSLNLLKSTEAWHPQQLERHFKFAGARTRSQFVFEVNKERMLLSPEDWLVYTDSGWKKFTTTKEIDDYVERKMKGTLFVFEGVGYNEEGGQVLTGTLYNNSRSDAKSIQIAMQQGSTQQSSITSSPIEEKDEEEFAKGKVIAKLLKKKVKR